TFVILTGGIDFSVGGIASLASVLLTGLAQGQDALFWPVLALVLLIGLAIGLVNGLAVIRLRVNPLIITLGTGSVLQGLSLLYRKQPGGSAPDSFQDLAFAHVAGVPVTALLLLAAFALAFLFLGYTRPGRDIYAVGDDYAAARLSGLPAGRALVVAYAVSGCMAAVTGAYLVSRTGVGDPRAGTGLELSSITPVVIGGTVLAGGHGGVVGTLLGVVLMTLLNNLLNFLDVSSYIQWIVQGAIVIAAVSASGKAAEA
ncbi:MAG: ABC transporter permease, partial [Pseudomonadota bacterium]|nr:ABC transporter permease [Pseudomonadota bacterium]